MSTTNARSTSLSSVAVGPQIVSSSGTFIKSLDGLRGLAILLVLWCHLDEFLRGSGGASRISAWIRIAALNAGTGVQLFFVLSGFLLFLPYARALVTPERAVWPRAIIFYQRRVKRIIPAYFTVVIGIICLMLTVQAQRQTFYLAVAQFPWGQITTGLLLLFDLHRSTFDLFAGVNPVLGYLDAPLWSLAVEWQFYLLLPLLAWGLSRLGTLRRVIIALVLVIVCGLALRSFAASVHYVGGVADPADAPGLLGLICSLLYGIRGKFLEVFALGMLASLFYVWGIEQNHWKEAQRRTLAMVLMPLCGAGLVFCSLWATFGAGRYEGLEALYWPSARLHGVWAVGYVIAGDWTFGLCATALLLIVLCLPYSWGKVFSLRPLTFIGLISYSLYLWHWPIAFLDIHSGSRLQPVVVLIIIFAWSVGIYYLVERPFLKYRRRDQPIGTSTRMSSLPETHA